MNQKLAQMAVDSANEYKKQKGQGTQGPVMQPVGLQMGALGKPDGYMPSTGYSAFNRV